MICVMRLVQWLMWKCMINSSCWCYFLTAVWWNRFHWHIIIKASPHHCPAFMKRGGALQCLWTSHCLLLQFFCPSFSLERRASRYPVECGPKWTSTLMKFLLSLSLNLHILANFVFYSIQCFNMLSLISVFSQNLWATLGLWGDKHSSWTHTPVGECLINIMSAYGRSADQGREAPG